jgi:hypothetical protein
VAYKHRYPANWDTKRRSIYRRDGYACTECGGKNQELHCHHIIPISQGGGHESSNLTTLCVDCHVAEHPHMWGGALNYRPGNRGGRRSSAPESAHLYYEGTVYLSLNGKWTNRGIEVPAQLSQKLSAQYNKSHPSSTISSSSTWATPRKPLETTYQPNSSRNSSIGAGIFDWIECNIELLFWGAVLVFFVKGCG